MADVNLLKVGDIVYSFTARPIFPSIFFLIILPLSLSPSLYLSAVTTLLELHEKDDAVFGAQVTVSFKLCQQQQEEHSSVVKLTTT